MAYKPPSLEPVSYPSQIVPRQKKIKRSAYATGFAPGSKIPALSKVYTDPGEYFEKMGKDIVKGIGDIATKGLSNIMDALKGGGGGENNYDYYKQVLDVDFGNAIESNFTYYAIVPDRSAGSLQKDIAKWAINGVNKLFNYKPESGDSHKPDPKISSKYPYMFSYGPPFYPNAYDYESSYSYGGEVENYWKYYEKYFENPYNNTTTLLIANKESIKSYWESFGLEYTSDIAAKEYILTYINKQTEEFYIDDLMIDYWKPFGNYSKYATNKEFVLNYMKDDAEEIRIGASESLMKKYWKTFGIIYSSDDQFKEDILTNVKKEVEDIRIKSSKDLMIKFWEPFGLSTKNEIEAKKYILNYVKDEIEDLRIAATKSIQDRIKDSDNFAYIEAIDVSKYMAEYKPDQTKQDIIDFPYKDALDYLKQGVEKISIKREVILDNPKFKLDSGEVVNKPEPLRKYYSPIEMMQMSGPDFMSNKFDVYFLWSSKAVDDTSILTNDNMTDLEKKIITHNGLAVRTGQIKVPAIINNDFSLSFLETQVNKIRSNKTVENLSTLTVRLDQDLFWIDEFSLISGRLQTLDNALVEKSNKHPYIVASSNNKTLANTISFFEGWQTLFKTVAKTWPTKSTGAVMNLKETGLCIVIKMEHLSNYTNLNYQQKVLPYFVFENVKILGSGEKLEYNRDSADIQTLSVDFIFKRCYEMLPKINVGNNDFGKAWERTTNSSANDGELDIHKNKWTIPIYDTADKGGRNYSGVGYLKGLLEGEGEFKPTLT